MGLLNTEIHDDCYLFMLSVGSIYSDLLRLYSTGQRFDHECELVTINSERSSESCVNIWREAYKEAVADMEKRILEMQERLSKISNAEYMRETIDDSQHDEAEKESA